MSTVYLAHDPHFERDVAIKLLPLELLHQSTFRRRFEREAKVVAALDHPAIVPVYDFGEEDGQPFLVMRFMMGGSLADRLRSGPVLIKEAAAIISRLAPALDEVHAHGVIHRDIKPSNILFDNRGDPYISDFGTAKITEANTKLTETGSAVGTPAYMSPEQIQGDAKLDGRSDIYSLGIILFEMLTGKHPYQTNTPIAVAVKHIFEPVPHILDVVPNLPIEVQEVIGRAMAKKRNERFPTAVSFARALTKIADTIETHTISLLGGTEPAVGKRHALIINTNQYQDILLNQLVKNPIDGDFLGDLLRQPAIGHFDSVKVLNNQPTERIRRHIARFFANKNSNDFLLLYYIGHAAMGPRGRIYLTAANSEHNLLRGTTLSAQFIADEMDSCKARSQILILDAHFSQAIDVENGRIIGQTVNVGANFTQNNPNRIVITASDSTQYMWQNGTIIGSARPSLFTKHLIEGLQSGAADLADDGAISINELFSFVSEQVLHNSLDPQIQTPRKWSPFEPAEESEVIIAHSVRQSDVRFDAGLVDKLQKDTSTSSRIGVPLLRNKQVRALISLFILFVLFGFLMGRGASRPQQNGRDIVFADSHPIEIAVVALPTTLPSATPGSTPVYTTTPTQAATQTASVTATAPLPSPTPTATTTMGSVEVTTAVALLSSSLYNAPDTESEEMTFVAVGEEVTVLGRSQSGDWLFIRTQDNITGFAFAPRFEWDGNLEALDVYETDNATTLTIDSVCSVNGCPVLKMEMYPLSETRCDDSGKYRSVFIRGTGGNSVYSYYWDNTLLVSNIQNKGFAFDLRSPDGSSQIGTGKVVSGDGQTVEMELFVGDFDSCNS